MMRQTLAVRINSLIHDVGSKQLAQISSRSSKELWASVKSTANGQHGAYVIHQHLFNDIEQAIVGMLLL